MVLETLVRNRFQVSVKEAGLTLRDGRAGRAVPCRAMPCRAVP